MRRLKIHKLATKYRTGYFGDNYRKSSVTVIVMRVVTQKARVRSIEINALCK